MGNIQMIIGYKFQAPDGSYWYIKADDQQTINYWQSRCKLIPLTDDKARIIAEQYKLKQL